MTVHETTKASSQYLPNVELSALLNINALDQTISIGDKSSKVLIHKFLVPVIKLRE